ncbi:MAG: GntR family transcriptional regulator [Clostridia bacterium]|nr:GntR family transcriptional regulator [Candidatus Pelethousia sp.]NCB29996.1 GntR family transcriptional regulator [Clostridia bacterium]
MILGLDEDRPLFLQVAELLEEAILSGAYPEESQVPSITELSVNCKINPATALKGVNLLVEQGLLYKKRGLGMFVSTGARARLAEVRRGRFYVGYIEPLLEEARKLGLSREDVMEMIRKGAAQV